MSDSSNEPNADVIKSLLATVEKLSGKLKNLYAR